MTTSIKAKNKGIDKIYILKCLIVLAIAFGFRQIPPIEPITETGMAIMGIFLAGMFGWLTMGQLWPSIFVIIALGSTTEIFTMTSVLQKGPGGTVAVMILFILIFSGMVENTGVSKYIAIWSTTRKAVAGRPWLYSGVFLFTCCILSATTNANAALLICWSIFYSVCEQLGYKPFERYTTFMIFGICIVTPLGVMLFPFRSIAILTLGAYTGASGISINYFQYMLCSVPAMLFGILCYLAVGKYILRCDVSKLKDVNIDLIKEQEKDALVLGKKQKYVLWLFLALIITLLIPSALPKTIGFVAYLNKLGAHGIVLLFVILCLWIRVDGEPLMDFPKCAYHGIKWESYLIASSAVPLGSALTDDATGIKLWISQTLSPLLEGKSELMFVAIIVGVAVLLTNICNNMVCGVLMAPFVYTFGLAAGLNHTALIVCVCFAVHYAMITPAACTQAGILYSNTEWIKVSSILKYCAWSLGIMYVFTILVIWPLAQLIF